jgi:hypothetical protein
MTSPRRWEQCNDVLWITAIVLFFGVEAFLPRFKSWVGVFCIAVSVSVFFQAYAGKKKWRDMLIPTLRAGCMLFFFGILVLYQNS